jgi:predicted enzyme related to lactoylglutathione lyase
LTLALHAGHKGASLKSCNPLAVQFLVNDAKKTIRALVKYGGIVKRPLRKIDFRPAELRTVYEAIIADPDGNEIAIQEVIREYKK